MDEREYFKGIESYRLLAKHEIGQNFLIDFTVARRIIGLLGIEEGERVLEIGSGAGSLTYFLAKEKGQKEAIDIDDGLLVKTRGELGDKVDIHYGNAARYDYSPYDKIVGNLPYYITSSIIEKVLLEGGNAKKLVFMVQKEAMERLLSPVGGKDYGPLNILMAWRFEAKREFNVPRSSFVPAPHIDSSVISFYNPAKPRQNLKKAYGFCKSLFRFRRKTVENNLKVYLNGRGDARQILQACSIIPTSRPETLSPADYERLFALVSEIMK